MDYWCKGGHTWRGHAAHAPTKNISLIFFSLLLLFKRQNDAFLLLGIPFLQTQLFCFLCSSCQRHIHYTSSTSSLLILQSLPHRWHACSSGSALCAGVILPRISILMGCPLCPCFLSLRFHRQGGRWRSMAVLGRLLCFTSKMLHSPPFSKSPTPPKKTFQPLGCRGDDAKECSYNPDQIYL